MKHSDQAKDSRRGELGKAWDLYVGLRVYMFGTSGG